MKYRIVKRKKLFGLSIYVAQEWDGAVEDWRDVEWGFDTPHTIWGVTLESTKRDLDTFIEGARPYPSTDECVWESDGSC